MIMNYLHPQGKYQCAWSLLGR